MEYGTAPESTKRKRDEAWHAAINANNEADFLSAIKSGDPREYVVNHDRILSFAKRNFKKPNAAYENPFQEFLPNTQLDSWALDNVTNWIPCASKRPQSLILVGESRLGKTAWARARGEHIYFSGQWNMEKLDGLCDTTKFIVWDDLYNWESFNYKQWLGGQWEFEVSGKYRAPRTVSAWGRPSIICCNELPACLNNQWVRDNTLIMYVRFKLYQ